MLGRRKRTGKNTPSESGATPKPETPSQAVVISEQNGEATENGESAEKSDDEDAEPEPPKTVGFTNCTEIEKFTLMNNM